MGGGEFPQKRRGSSSGGNYVDISSKYFSFLAYQRSVQLLYETVTILIEALTAFTVKQY